MFVLSASYLLPEMMFGWTAVVPRLEDTSKFKVTKDDVSWLGDYYHFLICYD